jgi:hypothetical protein
MHFYAENLKSVQTWPRIAYDVHIESSPGVTVRQDLAFWRL